MAWRRAGWQRLFIALLLVFVLADGFLGVLLPIQIPEVRADPDVASVQLWVDGFTDRVSDGWDKIGSSPYLDAQDQPNNYIDSTASDKDIGDFTFEDLPSTAVSVVNVTLYVYLKTFPFAGKVRIYVWDGSWQHVGDLGSYNNWNWKTLDLSSVLDTVDEVNNAKMYINSYSYGAYHQLVDAAYLLVYYEVAQPIPKPSYESSVQINSTHWQSRVKWSLTAGALDTAWICTNRTGVFQNESYTSLTGSSAWANLTLPINETVNVIKWKQYCNSTSGETNSTGWHYFYLKPVNVVHGHSTEYEYEECTFYSYWNGSLLANGIVEHNATGSFMNETVSLNNVKEGWINATVILPLAYQWVWYRFYAQDTDGDWTVTDWFRIWTWRKAFETYEKIFSGTVFGGENIIYVNGSRKAIYYAYLNSSDSKYYVVAYDIKNETWHGPVEIGTAPQCDGHWCPGIGYFPNGSLIVTYGYYENITYRYTVYSAFSESNITKLISNWSAERKVIVEPFGCYPRPISVGGYLRILYRAGGSTYGTWHILTWNKETDEWEDQTFMYEPEFQSEDFRSLYLRATIIRDKILITGTRCVGGTTFDAMRKDILFCYSDDYGETWRMVNGTQLTLPIKTTQIIV